jgi:hypothetical protein
MKYLYIDRTELRKRNKTRMNDNEMKRKKEILKVKNIEDYSDQQIESDDLKQLEKQFDQKLKCLKDTHKY